MAICSATHRRPATTGRTITWTVALVSTYRTWTDGSVHGWLSSVSKSTTQSERKTEQMKIPDLTFPAHASQGSLHIFIE